MYRNGKDGLYCQGYNTDSEGREYSLALRVMLCVLHFRHLDKEQGGALYGKRARASTGGA
jgi:hypothetical protein